MYADFSEIERHLHRWNPAARLDTRRSSGYRNEVRTVTLGTRRAADAWEASNGWAVEPDYARRRLDQLRAGLATDRPVETRAPAPDSQNAGRRRDTLLGEGVVILR